MVNRPLDRGRRPTIRRSAVLARGAIQGAIRPSSDASRPGWRSYLLSRRLGDGAWLASLSRGIGLSSPASGALLCAIGLAATRRLGGTFPVSLSDTEWERRLDPRQFDVLRREGTERPFSSPLNHEIREGRFACAGCGTEAFSSKTKFDSPHRMAELLGAARGERWPTRLTTVLGNDEDRGSLRDLRRPPRPCLQRWPKPTGLRYCMNGVALRFVGRSRPEGRIWSAPIGEAGGRRPGILATDRPTSRGGAAGCVRTVFPGPYRFQRELSLTSLVGLVTRRPPTL